MNPPQFVTALNCMDGRTQLPVIRYLKRKYKAAFVDTITEPGIVRLANKHSAGTASVRKRLKISVDKHHSRHVALVAHHGCAGNPVSDQKQQAQVKAGVLSVKKWNNHLEVIGLWVGPDWKVREIAQA